MPLFDIDFIKEKRIKPRYVSDGGLIFSKINLEVKKGEEGRKIISGIVSRETFDMIGHF